MKRLALVLGSLLLTTGSWAKLSPLAPPPDWSKLAVYQNTITKDEFVSLLDTVYAPGGAWKSTITVHDDAAIITTSPGSAPLLLRFASTHAAAKSAPSYWRGKNQLPPMEPRKPLAGLKIALDPGHLGGTWAKMEERWFKVGNSAPVTEGDMTLKVAKILVPKLEALGAEVFLTRSKPGPVTSLRPGDLKKAAKSALVDKKESTSTDAISKESEKLFYRVGEIRRRGRLVNETIRPDVVICLHFNAEEWGDEKKPTLVDENHLHFLITGAWSADELAYEDQRYDMLTKLLSRSFTEESALGLVMAKTMAAATGLPPYVYHGSSAVPVAGSSYLWARNLLANRLFNCPVVYAEPYVMNSRGAFARIQAGDYDGKRNFGWMMRKSIYREYSDAIVDSLVAYYSKRPL